MRTRGGSILFAEQDSILDKCYTFFLSKRKLKEEWLSSLIQAFIPFYLPSVMELRLEVLDVG